VIDVETLNYVVWAALAFGCILIHLVIDWFFQNEWMAVNKVNPRHPAGYIHAGLHGIGLLLLLPVWACVIVAVAHWLIDLRSPLTWWKKTFRQTREGPIAMHVGIWTDQVAHFIVIALAAWAVI
jgi:hypothetical protein